MIEVRLYLAQRVTAALMVPLIVGHLATILYAVNSGLSAGEILSRTQGSVFWGGFYCLFVFCAALHGAIGLRTIGREWTPLSGRAIDVLCAAFCLILVLTGLRAVAAVVAT